VCSVERRNKPILRVFAVIFVTNTRFLSLFVVLVGDQYGTSGGGAMSAVMGLWELRRVLPPPLWRRLFEHALT